MKSNTSNKKTCVSSKTQERSTRDVEGVRLSAGVRQQGRRPSAIEESCSPGQRPAPTVRVINQPTNKQTYQPTNKPTYQPTNKPIINAVTPPSVIANSRSLSTTPTTEIGLRRGGRGGGCNIFPVEGEDDISSPDGWGS